MLFSGRVVLGLTQVRQEGGPDELVVNELGSVQSGRKEAPDEEYALEHPVERNQSQDEIREKLDETQGGEDHPVSQPTGVVLLRPRLDGQDRGVGGVGESDGVADELRTVSDDDHSRHKEARTEDYFPPLHTTHLLRFYQILIELVVLLEFFVQHEQGGIDGYHYARLQ